MLDNKTDDHRNHQFANEEVSSAYGYLGYNSIPTSEQNQKDLEKELEVLRSLFPELQNSDVDRTYIERIRRRKILLPFGAERWTLIPLWEKIAPTYSAAVNKVFDVIGKVCNGKFDIRLQGRFDQKRLCRKKGAVLIWKQLYDQQKGHDILVVPVQMGFRHRGRSVRRALELMDNREFCLSVFDGSIFLLTHPERLQHHDDLKFECPGDECYPPGGIAHMFATLQFGFMEGGLSVTPLWYHHAWARSGSASSFLPSESR